MSSPPVTPTGGSSTKKKKSSSIFSNKFSKAVLKSMEKPGDDGWMQVSPKPKPKRSARSKKKNGTKPLPYYDEEDEESVISRPTPEIRAPPIRSPSIREAQEEKFQQHEDELMRQAENHKAEFYTEDEIKNMVLQLGLAKTWEEAFEAAQLIRVILKVGSQEKKADAAHKLYYLQILPAVVLKLQEFGHEFDQLAEFAIRILVQMTYFEPSSKQDLVFMGAMPAVYRAAHDHFPGDLYVSGNVAILLSNIALEEDLQEHVAHAEYRAFVLEHMQAFPDEPYTQKVCSKYLYNVTAHVGETEHSE